MGYYDDVRDGLIPPDSPIHEQFKQLQREIQKVIDTANGIVEGTYTSYWEDGAAVSTAAKWDPITKVVFDIEMSGTYIDSSLTTEQFSFWHEGTGKTETFEVRTCDTCCDRITSNWLKNTNDWMCMFCYEE